jgi:hypothetical protein
LGCLAIKTSKRSILNGHYVISKTSTTINLGDGIRIDYIVNDTDEIIKSIGNFSEKISIQVFLTKIFFLPNLKNYTVVELQ